jgi:hypothetical protein
MNPILQAMKSGYDPDKILDYLSKALPQIGGTIFKAKSAGYTVKQILGFLTKTSSESDTKGMSNPEIRARNRRTDADLFKNGLTMAAGALGAATIGRAAVGAISQRLPGQSTRGTPNAPGTGHIQQAPQPTTPQLPPTQSTQTAQIGQTPPISEQPPVSSSPQQPPISQAPIVAQQPKTINAKEILDKHNATNNINNLLNANKNDPEKVGAWLRKFNLGSVNKIEKETGKPIEDFLKDYLDQNPQNAPNPQPKPNNPSSPSPLPTSPGIALKPIQEQPLTQKQIESPQKEKAAIVPREDVEETVITPSGRGKIKEISGDNALIEEDGKLKQHKLDKVIQSEISEEDLADLYEDLKKGIEKHTGKQISRNVESAGYDPKNNELVYKPHGSDKFYVYDDISPEDVEALTNLLTQRKSTGENFIGRWESGTESPIGAAMYQLIKKLQSERGGKGNEYKNRFETIYDALEPAKEALKKRYAEQKRKERETNPKKKAKKPRAS